MDDPLSDGVGAASPGGEGRAIGRRTFLAGTVGAAAGFALWSSPADAAVAAPAGATYFVPLTPERLCDTRPSSPGVSRDFGYTRLDATTVRVQIAGRPGIPADAVAAVFNLAGIARSAQPSWVQAVPAGTTSDISNLNLGAVDPVVANLCTVKLGGGAVDLRSRAARPPVARAARPDPRHRRCLRSDIGRPVLGAGADA